jgi:hypothetical protein
MRPGIDYMKKYLVDDAAAPAATSVADTDTGKKPRRSRARRSKPAVPA